MKTLACLLILTLWLAGCTTKGPTAVHQLVAPAEFVALGQQSAVVADALCMKVEPDPPGPSPDAQSATKPMTHRCDHATSCCAHFQSCCNQPASTGLLVTFQITQTLSGRSPRNTWMVRIDPSLATAPGVDGQPFFVEGRSYRLFFSGDSLQIGCLEQFDRFVTHQLGHGGAFEVHVLPLGRR